MFKVNHKNTRTTSLALESLFNKVTDPNPVTLL